MKTKMYLVDLAKYSAKYFWDIDGAIVDYFLSQGEVKFHAYKAFFQSLHAHMNRNISAAFPSAAEQPAF